MHLHMYAWPLHMPAQRLTCTYSGSLFTALLMAHTRNCTSVSSAVALLLNLQQQGQCKSIVSMCNERSHLKSCAHADKHTDTLTQPHRYTQNQRDRRRHNNPTHLSASTSAPRLAGSPALCSRSLSLKALPSTRVRCDSCSSWLCCMCVMNT